MDHNEEPPRLFDHSKHGHLIRALREDTPSAATSARILQSIRGSPDGGGGGGATIAKHWPRFLLAAVLGIGGVALFSLNAPGPIETPTAPHESVVSPAGATHTNEDISPHEVVVEAPSAEPADPPAEAASRHRHAAPPSEEELIAEARQHVRTRPSDASRVLSRHARLYRHGVLAPEREALRAEIAIRHGDFDAGQAALARFSAAHPGSAHLERLRRLLDEH